MTTIRQPLAVNEHFQMEADVARGVFYLHSRVTGQTLLRICRLPCAVRTLLKEKREAALNLQTDHPLLGLLHETVRPRQALVLLKIGSNEFQVVSLTGELILQVERVPDSLIEGLAKREFTDITIGYTGKVHTRV